MSKPFITVLLGLLICATGQADVFNMDPGVTSLEFVTVGDVNNGPVSYDYQMGKYEVTAGQYAEFLNAVASTDTNDLFEAQMQDFDSGGISPGSAPPGT